MTYLRPLAANMTVMNRLRKSTGLISEPDVDFGFYYDTAFRVIRAIK